MAPKSKNFLNFIVSFLQRFLGFSCEAASPRLRASEGASKREREEGKGGWGDGKTAKPTDTQRERARARAQSRAWIWKTVGSQGARCLARSNRDPERGARVVALRARSAGCGEAQREAWRRRNGAEPSRAEAERGAGAVRTQGASRSSQPRGSRSSPRKSRLGGVATRCSSSPPPSSPAPLWGPLAEGGRGKEGAVGKWGMQAFSATALACSREGPRRTQGAHNNRMQSRIAGV